MSVRRVAHHLLQLEIRLGKRGCQGVVCARKGDRAGSEASHTSDTDRCNNLHACGPVDFWGAYRPWSSLPADLRHLGRRLSTLFRVRTPRRALTSDSAASRWPEAYGNVVTSTFTCMHCETRTCGDW
jgi:hypothetical protein